MVSASRHCLSAFSRQSFSQPFQVLNVGFGQLMFRQFGDW